MSGPSGAGKSTLGKKAVDFFGDLRFSISYTTRLAREHETEGVEYRFVTEPQFDSMVERGEFIEHACVHGNKYGTARADLMSILESGQDVMLDIDVQGASQLSSTLTGLGVYVFVLPPSIEESKKRLSNRGDIAADVAERRLEAAIDEIKEAAKDAGNYDYIIINDLLDAAFNSLRSIITAERTRKEAVMETVREKFEI